MVELGLSPEKICVIPNGVDTSRFHPLPRQEARHALGLSADGKIAVCVASLTVAKNLPLLISSFAKMLGGRADAKLFIVGEGPLRGLLDELISKLQLRGKVTLVGAKPNGELALWFNAADVSCLVSSREGWPNVIMESLACGTPVVATRVGGVPEIISSPELGVLAEQNSESIAAALRFALVKEWDQNGLSLHAQLSGWDEVASKIEQYMNSHVCNPAKK
jgi:teichuronic acid biosynthesis glycosyltransferase TuaC